MFSPHLRQFCHLYSFFKPTVLINNPGIGVYQVVVVKVVGVVDDVIRGSEGVE